MIIASLRPYSGQVSICKTLAEYHKAHRKVFGEMENVSLDGKNGRMCGGCNAAGYWQYVIWGRDMPALVHELSHVVLHLFERCDIDPRGCGGEPFCYLLQQLVVDSKRA